MKVLFIVVAVIVLLALLFSLKEKSSGSAPAIELKKCPKGTECGSGEKCVKYKGKVDEISICVASKTVKK